jgi:hypothetical protein
VPRFVGRKGGEGMKKRIVMLLTVVALMVVILAIAVGPASAQTMTGSGDLFIMMPMGGHHSMTMGGDHFMMMPMG